MADSGFLMWGNWNQGSRSDARGSDASSWLALSLAFFAMLSRSPEETQATAYAGDANNSTYAVADFSDETTLVQQTTIELTPIELTVGIGLLKFLTTCLVILCIERSGRRLWLFSGMSIILLSLTFL